MGDKLKGIRGILKGFRIVFSYFTKKRITFQYPEEKRELPERFRGRVTLDLDTCIGCSLCSQICPNHCDVMVEYDYENGKNKRKIYPSVDIGKCIYCGLCQEICPTGAITLSKDYETARYKKDFEYLPDRLSKPESEVNRE